MAIVIPLCDVKQQYQSLKPEIDAAIQAVCASGQYILGPHVRAFEKDLAKFCQCEHAVGVGSGTDALHLALRALEIGAGDEVITTPFTFIATSEAIGLVGATPVFVDIDPRTFNIDPKLIEAAVTPRTKAILPVHMFGQPCDMDPILEVARWHELYVVEDCAQAVGAAYKGQAVGTFGDAGCLSFFPSKNLGCFGDGGAVLTKRQDLFEQVEILRRHGGRVKYHHSELGLNSRLDELQAAILQVKLVHLNAWSASRRQHAYRYNLLLEGNREIERPAELTEQGTCIPVADNDRELLHTVYHQYTVLLEDRDGVSRQLQEDGIASFPYYPVPLHLQAVHKNLNYGPGSFPCAEDAARRCLSLPMFPELTDRQQDEVVRRLGEAVATTEKQGNQAA